MARPGSPWPIQPTTALAAGCRLREIASPRAGQTRELSLESVGPMWDRYYWTTITPRPRIDCMFNQLRGTTAPLPADEVAAAYASFGDSRMLPRGAYVDPSVYDWEQANIFSGWMCLGRGEKFSEPGAQTAVETGAGGVLLVRGEDGALRAFANVCRHRGHELVACGVTVSKRSIVCPYHGW